MEWFDVSQEGLMKDVLDDTFGLYSKSNLKIHHIELSIRDFERFVGESGYETMYKMNGFKQTEPIYCNGIPVVGNITIMKGNMGVVQDVSDY